MTNDNRRLELHNKLVEHMEKAGRREPIHCIRCGEKVIEFRGEWWNGQQTMCPGGEQEHSGG